MSTAKMHAIMLDANLAHGTKQLVSTSLLNLPSAGLGALGPRCQTEAPHFAAPRVRELRPIIWAHSDNSQFPFTVHALGFDWQAFVTFGSGKEVMAAWP